MRKVTTVMNLLTEQKQTFYNDLNLKENLINGIIYSKEDKRKLLNLNYRQKIEIDAKIEIINSKNGNLKAYSQFYDMIAYKK
tara:strand:+ start:1567 stop:1812 length:246 start_codon:yes stop_codon:yes gene_type:complete